MKKNSSTVLGQPNSHFSPACRCWARSPRWVRARNDAVARLPAALRQPADNKVFLTSLRGPPGWRWASSWGRGLIEVAKRRKGWRRWWATAFLHRWSPSVVGNGDDGFDFDAVAAPWQPWSDNRQRRGGKRCFTMSGACEQRWSKKGGIAVTRRVLKGARHVNSIQNLPHFDWFKKDLPKLRKMERKYGCEGFEERKNFHQ
jgi:hypothetical protein